MPRILLNNKVYVPLLAIALIMVAICCRDYYESRFAAVSFLNVGQGDSAIISLPNNRHILIDSGNSYMEERGYDTFLGTYLNKSGIKNIDIAILSHYHDDHGKAFLELLQEGRIGTLIIPAPNGNYETPLHDMLFAANTSAKILYVDNPANILTLDYLTLDVVYFNTDAGDENNRSLVLKLKVKEYTMLFCGDIERTAENDVVNSGVDVRADLLKVPHHGSATSTSQAFLEAVSPSVAVISSGNTSGHPSPEVVERLRQNGVEVFSIVTDGMYTKKIQVKDWFGK